MKKKNQTQRYIDALVKKHNATAVLIFILGCIIAFASFMMSLIGVINYSQKDWCFEGLNPVCETK